MGMGERDWTQGTSFDGKLILLQTDGERKKYLTQRWKGGNNDDEGGLRTTKQLRFIGINFYLKLIKFIPLTKKNSALFLISKASSRRFFSRWCWDIIIFWMGFDREVMENWWIFFDENPLQNLYEYSVGQKTSLRRLKPRNWILITKFRLTCGHILHWYFRPLPFVKPDDILVALIGCGTTSNVDGCPCKFPGELLLEAARNGPEAP